MKAQMEKVRGKLADLAALSARTEAAERKILERAEQRHAEVSTAIDRARTGVECAPDDAQQRYLDLVRERGQLDVVISKARKALGL